MLRRSHAGRDQLRIGRLLSINQAGTRCVAVVSRVTNRGGAPLRKCADALLGLRSAPRSVTRQPQNTDINGSMYGWLRVFEGPKR